MNWQAPAVSVHHSGVVIPLSDIWVMGLIFIGVLIWICFGLRTYARAPEPMEDICLSDRFPEDEEALQLVEDAGYELIGGKFCMPLHFTLDDEEIEARIWIDMIVKRDNQWYIVRIARERMKLDWDGSGMKRQWMPYFAAYPESAGLLVVDMLERRVRLIRMDWGEAYVHGE